MARESGFLSIGKPVAYSLTEKAETELDAAVVGAASPARRPPAAPLGRSPALLPGQGAKANKRRRKPAKAGGKHEPLACVAAGGPVPEDAFAPFRAPLVSCRRCIQLMLELDEAVRAYTAVARPFLAQWAQMSFGQVKEFERQTESLKNAVRSARRKLENHQRDAGCA